MLHASLVAGVLAVMLSVPAAQPESAAPTTGDSAVKDTPKSIYDFTVKDIDGKDVALSKYKGDVLLIVNVASK